MSLLYASLTGIPIVKATLVVPYSGCWHADVTLDRAVGPAPVGPQVLTLAGSAWNCAPIRAIDYAGQRQVRLVGGTGGWRSIVPAREYASPVGVPTAVVLADAAANALELPPVVDPTVAPTLGPYFLRQAGRASLVLQQVLGSAWWMDAAGVVQTSPRLPVPVTTHFDALAVDGVQGRYEVATESPGDWMPGATFLGATVSGIISRVVHSLEQGTFRTEVMVA